MNARILEAARTYRARFETITEAAAALDIAQPTLSNFLNGKSGAGVEIAEKLAERLGMSLGELVDGVRPGTSAARPSLRALAGWDAAVTEARRRWPWLPAGAIEAAGDTNALVVAGPATPDLVRRFAQVWLDTLSADELEALERQRVRAEMDLAKDLHREAERIAAEMRARGETPPPAREIARDLHPATAPKRGKRKPSP